MSDVNLNVGELYIPELINELKLKGTNDKTYGNVLSQTEGETSEESIGIKKYLQRKYLIPIIIWSC